MHTEIPAQMYIYFHPSLQIQIYASSILQLSTNFTLCDELSKGDFVPQKVRELVTELERAGFVNRGGKGSHRNFVHPKVSKPITISGAPGDDAKHYQVRAVKRAVEESKS